MTRRRPDPRILLAFWIAISSRTIAAAPSLTNIRANPASIALKGPDATATLLIEATDALGRTVDLTAAATFRLADPELASIKPHGEIASVSDGNTSLSVNVSGRTLKVPVSIEGSRSPRALHFENDVLPVLSKLGCNMSGCHGKAEGQNGFKLSIFGFDPMADHAALTRESRGRRVFPAAPERSLLLQKIDGEQPHGGGVRTSKGSREYETLRQWIAAGAPVGDPNAPKVVSIRVEPGQRILKRNGKQQLRVIAQDSAGREADVTSLAKYQSNREGIARVDSGGLVHVGEAPGEVAIMASFANAVEIFRAVVPWRDSPIRNDRRRSSNPLDALIEAKLDALGMQPSGRADDATFLRRAYLDIIGTAPTPDEVRRFLADPRPDRRALLVDALLQRPEYATYWALKWADLLRVDRATLGTKGAYTYYRWIRDAFARNEPIDAFARGILTAEGPVARSGPAQLYKAVSKPGERASLVSQVFLGVRIACAECHHHPYDRWGQDDYQGMAAYFAPVGFQRAGPTELLLASGKAVGRHPRTNAEIGAHPLGKGDPGTPEPGDRRPELAGWMTSPSNPWFARNVANRYWAHFLGRGLVEPVDDIRATNPPSNPELLDALAKVLVENHFDLKLLIRAITGTDAYQRSNVPNATNASDSQNYSVASLRRIDAEVLLDMVTQATGVPEKFAGVPAGTRAIELWDSKVVHEFLKLFGRPIRATACECERNVEPSVGQVLHVLNSPALQDKLSHESGAVARLVRDLPEDRKLTEEMYLTVYARMPKADELASALDHFGKAGPGRRREAAEDLAWTMLNSIEFLFNH